MRRFLRNSGSTQTARRRITMGPGFFVSVKSKENPSQPLGDRKNVPDIILNALLGDCARGFDVLYLARIPVLQI